MGQTCKKDDDEDAGGTREELTEAPGLEGVPGLERLVVVERTGSTNDDLRSALTGADGRLDPCAATAWPHISALWAHYQDAGRGRAGRHWITPPGSALTVSFVLRPLVPAAALAWLPLLAGLAARDVVEGGLGVACGLDVDEIAEAMVALASGGAPWAGHEGVRAWVREHRSVVSSSAAAAAVVRSALA
mgnify:CR=1 FL=1